MGLAVSWGKQQVDLGYRTPPASSLPPQPEAHSILFHLTSQMDQPCYSVNIISSLPKNPRKYFLCERTWESAEGMTGNESGQNL